jgi:MoxR-like ATPase
MPQPDVARQTVVLDGVELQLAHPDDFTPHWVGQEELVKQLTAAWLVIDPADLPLNPRLVGKPGVGKTSLAYATARALGQEVYLFQATMDTRPEDLIITPVITDQQRIKYVASSLLTAMIRGGVCILDEGNRMGEKCWASLAPLLDARRYVESIVAGIKIKAHPDFRFCATMNEDASTFDIPEYIHSRLQPQIVVDFPEREEEARILRDNLPFADVDVLAYVVEFLQRAHRGDERYTVRDGINVARYALKLVKGNDQHPLSAYRQALMQVLGEEAVTYVE